MNDREVVYWAISVDPNNDNQQGVVLQMYELLQDMGEELAKLGYKVVATAGYPDNAVFTHFGAQIGMTDDGEARLYDAVPEAVRKVFGSVNMHEAPDAEKVWPGREELQWLVDSGDEDMLEEFCVMFLEQPRGMSYEFMVDLVKRIIPGWKHRYDPVKQAENEERYG